MAYAKRSVRTFSLELWLWLAFAISVSPIAHASPRETIDYLMRTPPSMMSFGMAEVNRYLNSGNFGFDSAAATFNGRDNITIFVTCFQKCSFEKTDDGCGAVIAKVREIAALKDGEAALPIGSVFAIAFQQYGYNPAGEPSSLGRDIDAIIHLHASVMGGPKLVQCEAPLLGRGYSIKRQ